MASREIHDITKGGKKIYPQTSTDAVIREDASNQTLMDYIEALETRLTALENKTQKLGTDGDFTQNISAPGFFQE